MRKGKYKILRTLPTPPARPSFPGNVLNVSEETNKTLKKKRRDVALVFGVIVFDLRVRKSIYYDHKDLRVKRSYSLRSKRLDSKKIFTFGLT